MKINKNILFLVWSIFILHFFSYGQQLPIYTNYILTDYVYNPAVAGSKGNAVATINYRNQWVGFKDAPKSSLASLHSAVGKQKKIGLGILINSDNTGLIGRTSGYLTFAYHIKLNSIYKLGFGVSFGMIQYRIKLYDAKTADIGDELLTGNVLSNNVFDSNGGLYLYSDKLFFGISTYQYLGNKINWKDSKSILSPHFYITMGYTFDVSKTISIQPSALFKINNPVPLQPELTLRGLYKKIVWVGTSLRINDAVSVLAGVTIKDKFSIGYSYDFPITKIRSYTSGSHEIVLSYKFIKEKKKLNSDEEELNNIDSSIKSKLLKQNEEGTK